MTNASSVEVVWTLITGAYLITHVANLVDSVHRARYFARRSPQGKNGRRPVLARGRARAEVLRSLSQGILFGVGVLAVLAPGGSEEFDLIAILFIVMANLVGLNSILDRLLSRRIDRMTEQMQQRGDAL